MIAMRLLNVRIKVVILTKWSGLGFLVENEKFVFDNKKRGIIYFSPLIWSLLILIDMNSLFLLMFPLVNIGGGMADFYSFFKIVRLHGNKRLEWVDAIDEKVLKSAAWKKEIKR